jgi:glycosyltransferase involved in cell wall biosynthesis
MLSGAGSASGARTATGGSARGRADWTAHLARRHDAYRAAVRPLQETVAIVCVSSRAHCLPGVIESVAQQSHGPRKLVLVTNSADYDDVDVEAAIERLGCPAVVLRRPAGLTLGSCLNDALDVTDARFVAKFDDDDLYGPEYLADAMRAHAYAGAAVVGKHTYYAYLASPERTVLRFPAHEFSYSSTLAGGTLVIDRALTGNLRFPDISLGEDRAFLTACHRRGLSTFSADRFSFVQVRAGDNTWTVDHDDFLVGTVPVADGLALDSVNI